MLRRLTTLSIVALLLVSYFAFFSPKTALAEDQVCYVFEIDLINNDTVPHTGTIFFGDAATGNPLTNTISLTLNPGETGTLRFAAFVPAGLSIFPGGGPSGLDFVTALSFGPADGSACDAGRINDGRINAYDVGAPLAAYCTSDGGIAVWDISDVGEGTLGFTVTGAEISAALSQAAQSGQNILVGEGLGNSLYALANGNLMLTGPDVKESGKTYQFFAGGDVCS